MVSRLWGGQHPAAAARGPHDAYPHFQEFLASMGASAVEKTATS